MRVSVVPIYGPEIQFQPLDQLIDSAMNKKLISKLIHKKNNTLHQFGGYFFRNNFKHILRGFCLEYTPSGIYIWDFRFPLYDFARIHLTYSARLRERAFIGKNEMSSEAIVDSVFSAPEVKDALTEDSPMSISRFAEFLKVPDRQLNPHAKLIYAATLILLEQNTEAAITLDHLPTILHPSDIPFSRQLKESLQKSPDTARTLLDTIRERNIHSFKLN